MTGSERIRVLVVDDSKTVRRLLVHLIGQDPVFQVVGEAARAQDVAELVRTHQPDVMTLDLDMPEMNGVELLRQLLPAHPLPVLVISSLRQESSPLVFAALEAGAVDYLHKPAAEDLAAEGREITHRLRVAANARVMAGRDRRPLSTGGPFQVSSGLNRDRVTVPPAVIAIGSSTGGTEALKHVLPLLPPGLPPVVIAQHIPAVFSAALAARLAELSAIRVCEVRDGQELLPSHAYIAPGGRQFRVVRDRGRLLAAVGDDAEGELYRPSVNHLYRSIAAAGVAPVIAVQLTGMGDDGIDGLWALRQQGGLTCLAQDEESSVVWGMPGEAVRAGLADAVLALDTIAAALIELSGTEAGAGSAALGRNAPPGAGGSLPRRA